MDKIDDDDQAILRFKHKQTMMGKAYEAASGFKNKNVFKSIRLPPLLRQLFLHCGEVWKEGVVPLRICLIELAGVWEESGFLGDCPLDFSKADVEKYQQEFREYRDHHKIYELAREYLGTDADGWIAPDDDFEEKQQRNKEILEICIVTVQSMVNRPKKCGRYCRTNELVGGSLDSWLVEVGPRERGSQLRLFDKRKGQVTSYASRR